MKTCPVCHTENEDDADLSIEWIAQMNGAARVCFELPKRLLDIVKEGNLDEIKQVLQLLYSPPILPKKILIMNQILFYFL